MVKKKAKRTRLRPRGPKTVTAFRCEDFANDVINARNIAGLTQRQVAKELGFSPSGLTFIENVTCCPGVDNFAKLCGKFKLDPTKYLIL